MEEKKRRKRGRKERGEEGENKKRAEINSSGAKAPKENIFVCPIPLVRLSSSRLELDLIHLCVAHPRDYLG